jgi:hypothetical protein
LRDRRRTADCWKIGETAPAEFRGIMPSRSGNFDVPVEVVGRVRTVILDIRTVLGYGTLTDNVGWVDWLKFDPLLKKRTYLWRALVHA